MLGFWLWFKSLMKGNLCWPTGSVPHLYNLSCNNLLDVCGIWLLLTLINRIFQLKLLQVNIVFFCWHVFVLFFSTDTRPLLCLTLYAWSDFCPFAHRDSNHTNVITVILHGNTTNFKLVYTTYNASTGSRNVDALDQIKTNGTSMTAVILSESSVNCP